MTLFTLDAIQAAHAQFTGPDFPKLVQAFKAIGMVSNEVNLQTGQVHYQSQKGEMITSAGIRSETIAPHYQAEKFQHALAVHQAGQTDFPTFCQDVADAGIGKWVLNLTDMVCQYGDINGKVAYQEAIPVVSSCC